jgi:serine/threonine protein phosphatase 1
MPEQTIFATLAAGRRNWAVASVHGEAERLAELHARLAERIAPEDNLVYLGNFLGRGDNVAGTVEELLVFRRSLMAEQISGDAGDIVYLRGSQEEMWHKLLQVQFAPDPRQVLEWMLSQGVGTTLEAYGGRVAEGRKAAALGAVALSQWTNRLRATVRATDGHDRLISVLRRAAFTGDGTLLFVNAGIDPNRPLSEQTDSFWWGGGKFEAIGAPYGGFNCVVRGFDHRHRGVIVKEHVASIDGGCGFGGPLVAACFDAAGRLIDTIEA